MDVRELAEALKEVEKPGTHDLWLFDVCSVQVGHLQGMQRKTALSRNVAMGSKSYSQSRMKSSGFDERMMTMDWQSLDPQVPGKQDVEHWP